MNPLSKPNFIMNLLIVLALALVVTACKQQAEETEPPTVVAVDSMALEATVCELEPEMCARNCAKCPDQEACFRQNGYCVASGLEFNDAGDVNVDIFTPGCHQEYPAGQCPNNPVFFAGDECGIKNPKNLIEWTDSNCHGPSADRSTYDCNAECLRRNLGNGTCQVAANACGAGNNSAFCKCDVAPPSP